MKDNPIVDLPFTAHKIANEYIIWYGGAPEKDGYG